MKLYKEYKEEQRQKEKEAKDRKEAGLPEQMVIIYERTSAADRLGNIARAFVLFLLIAFIGFIIAGCFVTMGLPGR